MSKNSEKTRRDNKGKKNVMALRIKLTVNKKDDLKSLINPGENTKSIQSREKKKTKNKIRGGRNSQAMQFKTGEREC